MVSAKEATANFIEIGITKSKLQLLRMFLLALLAGILLAIVSSSANVAVHDIENTGMVRLVSAAIFPFGLIMIIFTGAELFTGNNLMTIALMEKKITLGGLLRNWVVVYLGNFAGAVLVAWLVVRTGLLDYSEGQAAVFTIKMAAGKVTLPFAAAFGKGILCNMLVCLGVFMAAQAKDTAGKMLGAYVPVFIFVLGGFEHSIANMYYVPAGIFALGNEAYLTAASAAQINTGALTWGNLLVKNLLPVTLGNIVGGAVLVGVGMWFVYIRRQKSVASSINIPKEM